MNKTIIRIMSASILLGGTIVGAQAQPTASAPAPGANQTLQAPYTPRNPNLGPGEAHPLFTIGREPVVVWAPVEPPYSSKMNRSQAGNPVWDTDAD
ncbi:MAG TPA: hypothetical protein VGM32_21135 [Rhodopila sp.]|jgi:hypothetical protein